MKGKGSLLYIGLFLVTQVFWAQISPDCSNAIPICSDTPLNGGTQGYGMDDFQGAHSSGCLEQTPGGAIESNAAWYRFRTGASGELGFNIGFNTSEDWDFALYRASDCTDPGTPVRCNFFDNSDGEAFMGVGEDPGGNPSTVLYEDWLQVGPGEEYLLLINNFSNTNSGFSIQFTGSIFEEYPATALDCSIISNLLGPPVAACDNEFILLDATTPNALYYAWYIDTGNGFQAIPSAAGPAYQATASAMYRVEVGTPAGTLYSDVQVGFSPAPVTFPLTNEARCSDTATISLSQKDQEALGNQDPALVTISYHRSPGEAALGTNPLPKDHPLIPGVETLFVRATSTANAQCFDASQQFEIQVADTPLPDFPTEVTVCEGSGAVFIGDPEPNIHYSYVWDSGEQSPGILVNQSGTYTVTLSSAQGGFPCSRAVPVHVQFSQTPAIETIQIEGLQQSNTVTIQSNGTGSYEYSIDDGPLQTSNHFTDVAAGIHTVTLHDPGGCGTITETITVVGFPKFFTPNGDGHNDLWQLVGLDQLQAPVVSVYDRFGKLIRQLHADSAGWDGTSNGRELPASDYWFTLRYTNSQGQQVEARYLQNHFSLKR